MLKILFEVFYLLCRAHSFLIQVVSIGNYLIWNTLVWYSEVIFICSGFDAMIAERVTFNDDLK